MECLVLRLCINTNIIVEPLGSSQCSGASGTALTWRFRVSLIRCGRLEAALSLVEIIFEDIISLEACLSYHIIAS